VNREAELDRPSRVACSELFGFIIMFATDRLFDVRGGPLKTLEIRKFQWVLDTTAVEITGAGCGTLPFPVFRMVVGKEQHRAILMTPGRDIQPFVEFRRIKKNAVVNGHVSLVNERQGI
jgi:hypothetical protein